MNTQALSGKKIAILGGMGARGESRDALIAELGLADLDWIYSERNKVKEFANFCDSVYPGKYDYIFLLTKFISHKVWEHIKKADLREIRLVRVNGSYNAEGFIRALHEQYPVKQQALSETVLEPPVSKRLLALAEADNSVQTPYAEPVETSEGVFRASTSEEIKLSYRVQALEAQIKRLKENQQDPALVKSAALFYNAFVDFVGGYPIPPELKEVKDYLSESLSKHGVNVKTSGARVVDSDLRLSNIALSELLTATKETIYYFSEKLMIDRYGACITCGKHKSIGCSGDCHRTRVKQIFGYISKGLLIAKAPTPHEIAKLLSTRISEFE